MSDRVQLNVRLDKYPQLYEAIKSQAEAEGMSLNDFVIHALQEALGWELEPSCPPRIRSQLEKMLAPIQQRLKEVEYRLEVRDMTIGLTHTNKFQHLRQADLARRLQVSDAILSRRKIQSDFEQWVKDHDPDGVGWKWDATLKTFVSVSE